MVAVVLVLVLVASVASAATKPPPKPTHGVKGATFIKGAKGATGQKGAKGDKGAVGTPGPAGHEGAAGSTGANGTAGHDGEPGAQGNKGSDGTSSPLVFGPYASGSTDSGTCGNDWATDTFTRTYIVSPQSDGSFDLTELFKGTFVTLAGKSPGGSSACSTTIAAGITGSFYGDEAMTIPATAKADFNFTATCPAGCNGTAFMLAFFGTTFPTSYAWQFHYTTAGHGSWTNADHGNTGDIS